MKPLLLLSILLSPFFCPSASAAPTPQNVLMIVVDDMNDWVGCLGGHPQVKTPHIDRLAKRGLLFTNAHVAAPVCNPSRVATLTGRSYRVKDSQPPTPEPKKAKKSNEPSTAGAAS